MVLTVRSANLFSLMAVRFWAVVVFAMRISGDYDIINPIIPESVEESFNIALGLDYFPETRPPSEFYVKNDVLYR